MNDHPQLAGQALSIEEAIQELRDGRMVLIRDDVERENEVDLCLAAQFSTPEKLNFMLRNACGLVCVAMSGQRLDALGLPPLEQGYQPLQGTAFTISVDARQGTSTGISATDRAQTIRTLVDPRTRPADLARPGHVFPLRARAGGTLERRGHTEASVDLMQIAGLEPGAVICEVLDQDGEPARGSRVQELARGWGLGMISVEEIARYRCDHRISFIGEATLPTPDAIFRLRHYRELGSGKDYLALVLGNLADMDAPPPLLRLHSACMTGDVFGSGRCDCQAQLHLALEAIAQEGRGLLLYLPQEGRGIGLAGKLQAYQLQEQGYDTLEANELLGYPVDARDYATAIEILRALEVDSVRLLTNNPEKSLALQEGGIAVKRVPLVIPPLATNLHYLQTKQRRFGHLFDVLPLSQDAV